MLVTVLNLSFGSFTKRRLIQSLMYENNIQFFMENIQNFNRINYSLEETILCTAQLDNNFLDDIRQIADKKQSDDKSFFDEKKQKISDDILQEIHQKALWHAQANTINSNNIDNDHDDKRENMNCQCGCKKQKGNSLQILTNQQKIASLGSGIILLFFYLRQMIYLIACIMIIYGAFAGISNIFSAKQTTVCEGKTQITLYFCLFNEVSCFSAKRHNNLLVLYQYFLGLIMVIVWVIGTKFILKLGQLKDKSLNDSLDSAADYSIRINNLPDGQYEQNQLLDYLKYLWFQQQNQKADDHKSFPKIRSIQIIYNMEICRKIIEELKLLAIQMVNCFQKNQYRFSNEICQQKIVEYRNLKKQFIQKIITLEEMRKQFLQNSQFRKKLSTSFSLIEFYTQESQKQFLEALQTVANPIQGALLPSTGLQFKSRIPLIYRSPEPSDILWLNCEKKFNFVRVAIIWLVTFIILYIGYAIVSYLQTLPLIRLSNNIASTTILQLLNRLIWFWLSIVVAYEYNNTKTESIISSMKKSIIAQTINITVNPIIALFVNGRGLYGSDGFSGMALTYQLVMVFTMLIYNIFNPFSLMKKLILNMAWSRNIVIRYLCKVKDDIVDYESIKDLLAFYEGPQFPIAGSYVYMTTAVSHALFYCHIQPYILLLLFLNMIFFLLIMKYMLFKRCKVPELTNKEIFEFAMFLVNVSATYYAIGSIFFYLIDSTNQNIKVQNIIPSVIGLIIWFLANLDIGNHLQNFVTKLVQIIKKQTRTKKKGKQHIENGRSHVNNSQTFSMAAESKNLVWRRRQSYYKDSNANQLLQFQSILKKTKNQNILHNSRGKKLRRFCQSFCQNSFKNHINIHSTFEFPFTKSTLQKIEKKKQIIIENSDDNKQNSDIIFIPVMRSKNERNVKFMEQHFNSHQGVMSEYSSVE